MRRALQLSSLICSLFAVVREMGILAHPLRPRRAAIMPGTNFCGPGNFSGNSTELGWLADTDRCCRDHDFCPHYIDVGSVNAEYGDLKNEDGVSRFHCDCDKQFYDCLRNNIDNGTSSRSSSLILFIYFGLTRVKCFKMEYPIVRCQTYDEYSKDRCLLYYVNETLPKTYQWFDSLSNVMPATR